MVGEGWIDTVGEDWVDIMREGRVDMIGKTVLVVQVVKKGEVELIVVVEGVVEAVRNIWEEICWLTLDVEGVAGEFVGKIGEENEICLLILA